MTGQNSFYLDVTVNLCELSANNDSSYDNT